VCSLFAPVLSTMTVRAPRSTLSPYTTLFRSEVARLYLSELAPDNELFRELSDEFERTVNALLRIRQRDTLLGEHRFLDTALKLRSEEHTSELQSRENLVCRLLLEKKNKYHNT